MRSFAALLAVAVLAAGWPAAAQDTRAARAEREQQAQVLEGLGGAYDGPQAAYVSRIGERMAAVAGLRGRCVFTLVNSEVVNAFAAPPGCHVYVTRGLLSLLNSEAELAAVLGHEVGHVAADHATRQRNQQVATGLAAALVGALAKSDLVGEVAGKAAQLGVLSYSRNQEFEADNLSLHYLPLAGYDPRALAAVLDALQREEAFTAHTAGTSRSLPAWASTHPLTADRIRRADDGAAGGAADPGLEVGAPAFLAALDGLAYGDDPVGGVIRGGAFLHPGLRIGFQAPGGFRLVNASRAVGIEGPGALRGEFAAGRATAGRLEDYAAQVLAAVAGSTPLQAERPQHTVINGLDAVVLAARAFPRSGPVDLTVAAYAVGDGRAYHFVTIAPVGQGRAVDDLIGSFHRLSEREAAAVGARRISVVTVRAGDTSESLAARMAGEARLERFRLLNALDPGEALAPGRKVKLVVDGGG
ncbi:MAG: M48 family metalloprotease [Caulobacterales bacterium]|nr:M48 family metalloprotease [Caulobacterales bacterium]